jgi:hypothetical protein
MVQVYRSKSLAIFSRKLPKASFTILILSAPKKIISPVFALTLSIMLCVTAAPKNFKIGEAGR